MLNLLFSVRHNLRLIVTMFFLSQVLSPASLRRSYRSIFNSPPWNWLQTISLNPGHETGAGRGRPTSKLPLSPAQLTCNERAALSDGPWRTGVRSSAELGCLLGRWPWCWRGATAWRAGAQTTASGPTHLPGAPSCETKKRMLHTDYICVSRTHIWYNETKQTVNSFSGWVGDVFPYVNDWRKLKGIIQCENSEYHFGGCAFGEIVWRHCHLSVRVRHCTFNDAFLVHNSAGHCHYICARFHLNKYILNALLLFFKEVRLTAVSYWSYCFEFINWDSGMNEAEKASLSGINPFCSG